VLHPPLPTQTTPAEPAPSLRATLKANPSDLPWNRGLAKSAAPPPPAPAGPGQAVPAVHADIETEVVKGDMMLMGLERRQLLRKQLAEEKKKKALQQREIWVLRQPYAAEVAARCKRFICPIGAAGEPMQDPVIAADGHTYDRSNIQVCPCVRLSSLLIL
jgi:hypothetical protein